MPRLRQEVCGRCCGTADSNAALAAILEEMDLPRAIIQSLGETCKCPICILYLGDDLEEVTIGLSKLLPEQNPCCILNVYLFWFT